VLLRIGQRPDHGFDRPLGLLSDCHRRIEHFLGALLTITGDARGGAMTDAQRAQLDAAATYFAVAAPRHTADEEVSLFPRLRDSQDPAAARALQIVAGLEADHQAADQHHQAVDGLVRRWLSDGSLAPVEVEELSRRLTALQRIYQSHIATEDEILFPVAARLLTDLQLRAIGLEMAGRRRVPR
jgi:iron-sulfur cluster repair protein YtfE (RIC family)